MNELIWYQMTINDQFLCYLCFKYLIIFDLLIKVAVFSFYSCNIIRGIKDESNEYYNV